MATVQISIDGTSYDTRDDDQEAAALLRLAGRDPARFDLFLVDTDGIETHVDDDQIVDLHDGEAFRTRHTVRFTIDGTPFVSYDDDQTALALLELAGDDPALRTLTRLDGHGVVESFTDEQLITIADGDRFETAERHHDVTIVVNTRPHQWADKRISYSQVVELAYPGQPITAEQDVTVRYTYRNGHGGGTLTAGHDVEVKEGMVFDVHRTTRS